MRPVTDERRREIAAGLASAHERIRAAEASAGRVPGSVGLVVVTKTFPASDVNVLGELGVSHIGENRDQEAAPKAVELAGSTFVWHFIGQLQTNKVRSVAAYASVVESVDRPKLVTSLSRAAVDTGRDIDCLVQVSLDDRPGRGGAATNDVPGIADAVQASAGLTLRGVMAVAPLGQNPQVAFGRLAQIAGRLRGEHPDASVISAGMSNDLEAAVQHGATHVRLGSAILGSRPPVR